MGPKLTEFQSRVAGLTLGHCTTEDSAEAIRKEGFNTKLVYACVEQGWASWPVNLQFRGNAVAAVTYPDPEGQWGGYYSMESAMLQKTWPELLDEMERFFEENPLGFEDPLDPSCYNLVILGPIPSATLL